MSLPREYRGAPNADMTFGEWLELTEEKQQSTFGLNISELRDRNDASYDAYVSTNIHALHEEVSELSREFNWKPWKSGHGVKDRDAAVGEAVDVLHFLANLLTLLGCDGEELTRRYMEKVEENERRQRDGY